MYVIFNSLVESDIVNIDLIPRQPAEGCYAGSVERLQFSTCACEDHCRWDMCRLKTPSNQCLFGTGGNWIWDFRERAWIAQRTAGHMFE